MATSSKNAGGKLVEMNWDPITRIVGSLGIYTKIDFEKRKVAECQVDLVDLPRLQRVHEGQGSARLALHHQPHLRHLRRQPRHLLLLRAEHGLRRSSRRTWPSGSSTSAKPPSTCSTTTSSRRTWSASTSARRWCKETNPGVWSRAEKTEAPHAAEHGYRTIGDIMKSVNPIEGEFYREALHGQPPDARDVLPHGRAPRASVDALSGRRRHRGDGAAVHRLPDAAHALRRLREARGAAARRSVRLLLRGAARLSTRSGSAASCSAAGAASRIPRSATSSTTT